MNSPHPGVPPQPGWRLRIHDELPSTADHCRELAQSGEPDGFAVMARRQTAGRGSRGRVWQSASGNLALSMILRPAERVRDMGQWALLAGLALAEALDARPGGRLTLKWPNDLLLDGRKLAGVLVEANADAHGKIAWMVVSTGVNLASAPDIPGREVASLDGAIAPEALAWRLMERISAWRQQQVDHGFDAIRAAWLRLAQPVGTAITVKLPQGEASGRFAGLNDSGNLLLRSETGQVQAILAGEVWAQHVLPQAQVEPRPC